MNDIKKLLGKRIKELRKSQNISQQELAERANIDQRSLSHIECGDTFPSRVLFELAQALNVELKELFDFNYLKTTSEDMKQYVIQSLDSIPEDSLKIIYRFMKSMR